LYYQYANSNDQCPYDIAVVCRVLTKGIDIGQHNPRVWSQILKDVPARLRYAQSDIIELRPIVYDDICEYYQYTPCLDLFANSNNTKCKKFYFAGMPGTFGFGAFAFNWSTRDAAYANPPWCLLELTIAKIVQDEVRCLVVTPIWTQREFYKTLVQIASKPYILTGRLYKRRGEILDAPRWASAAWMTDVQKIRQLKLTRGLAVPGGCKDRPIGRPLLETTRPRASTDVLLMAHHQQFDPMSEDEG
jgi:hypothetical protein